MEVLFKTLHGSRLYGLSHNTSDRDFYTVVIKPPTKKKRYSTHTIVGSDDSVVVDLGTWLTLCEKGVPQALEAMFSTIPSTDNLAALRAGYRAGPAAYDTYLRTIKSFAMQDTLKSKRHALRLSLNMKEMRKTGRFNPTLRHDDVKMITSLAELPAEHVLVMAETFAWGLDKTPGV